MDIFVVLFSIVLLGSAAGLLVLNVRTWRMFQRKNLDAGDFRYRQRQFRRRIQISAMIGLLGIALFVGQILMTWRLLSPLFIAVYWFAVILVTCWVLLLALVDIWATTIHFGRKRDRCLVEQAVLEAEARRIRAVRGNGKAKKNDEGMRTKE